MSNLDFINFILESHPSINPETGKRYRKDKQIEEVRRIVNNSQVPRSRIWITYSDIPKLGIKPETKESKSTPAGVFAYPVDYYLSKNSKMPYANDRNFLIIFEVKGKLLEVGVDYMENRRKVKANIYNPNIIIPKLNRNLFFVFNEIKNYFQKVYKNVFKNTSTLKLKQDIDNILDPKMYKFENLETKLIENIESLQFDKNVFDTESVNFFKKEVIRYIKAIFSIRELEKNINLDEFKVPMKEEIKLLCSKYSLNFEDVFNNSVKLLTSKNPRSISPSLFLYYLTKNIAILSTNEKTYHTRWNIVLRELGFSGVIDTKDSGNVHSSENTQGAFLDVRQLKVIDILHNLQGSYDRSGRWSVKSWGYNEFTPKNNNKSEEDLQNKFYFKFDSFFNDFKYKIGKNIIISTDPLLKIIYYLVQIKKSKKKGALKIVLECSKQFNNLFKIIFESYEMSDNLAKLFNLLKDEFSNKKIINLDKPKIINQYEEMILKSNFKGINYELIEEKLFNDKELNNLEGTIYDILYSINDKQVANKLSIIIDSKKKNYIIYKHLTENVLNLINAYYNLSVNIILNKTQKDLIKSKINSDFLDDFSFIKNISNKVLSLILPNTALAKVLNGLLISIKLLEKVLNNEKIDISLINKKVSLNVIPDSELIMGEKEDEQW